MSREIREHLKPYAGLAAFISRTLGSAFEVVLFDTTQEECPVAVSSGWDQEMIRAARQMVLTALENKSVREKGMLLNRAVQLGFAKLVKISVYLIKGEEDQVIGALCLSMQCLNFMKMQGFFSEILKFDLEELDDDDPEEDPGSLYAEPTLDMIDQKVREFGVEPDRFSPQERLEIMCDLYDLGVFELKGSVARAAKALSMSEQSVYRYLSKLKKARS